MGNEKLFDPKAKAAAAQKKEKRDKLLIGIAVVLAIVLMIGLITYKNLTQSGFFLRQTVAAESENFEVDGAMMQYFFKEVYMQNAAYASYLGIDTSKSLKGQANALGTGSWFDYFMDSAEANVNEVLALCEAANAAGVSLTNEDMASIDASMDLLRNEYDLYYSANFASFKQFLLQMYGKGVEERDIRHAMELTALASKYANDYMEALSYTKEDTEAYYQENADKFDTVDILMYSVSRVDFVEASEDGSVTGDLEAASAEAKAKAEALAKASTADEFKALVKDYIVSVKGEEEDHAEEHVAECVYENLTKTSTTFAEEIMNWAFGEEAKAGDTEIYTEDDAVYDVYYLVSTASRDETKARDVRHILFAFDNYATKEDAKAAADAAYAEWDAAGFTIEKFEELSTKYNNDPGSVDNGGLYEDVTPGAMVTEFNNWLFAEKREPADRDVIETSSYGYHIMYYAGESDKTVWELNAESALKNEAYNDLKEANSGSIVFHENTYGKIDG